MRLGKSYFQRSIKDKALFFKSRNLVLFFFIVAVFTFYFLVPLTVQAATTCGTIAVDETWTAPGTYTITCELTVESPATLTIQAGVVVRIDNGFGDNSLYVKPGAHLHVDGVFGNPVIFEQSSGTSPGSWQRIKIEGSIPSDSSSHIDYANFHHGGNKAGGGLSGPQYYGALWIDDASTSITGCVFEDNVMGVFISGQGNPIITDTDFNRNTYVGISFVPGANPTLSNITYGAGADANGFDAIGLGHIYGDSGWGRYNYVEATTANLSQENGIAGFSNIPYLNLAGLVVSSGKTLNIAAGVIIKMGPAKPRLMSGPGYTNEDWPEALNLSGANRFTIEFGGILSVNGTSTEHVIFTSTYDDTKGGDTNLDDSATSASSKDWAGIQVEGFVEIEYAEFYYSGRSCMSPIGSYFYTPTVELSNSSSTIDDSLFEDNVIGVYSSGTGNPSISDTTFNRNRYVGISFVPGAHPTLSSIFYGTGADANGFDAIGIGKPHDSSGLPGCIEMSATTGSISREDNIFGLLNVPYVSLHCLTVPSGKTLTINSGVLIKMGPNDVGDGVKGGRWTISSGATFLVRGTDDNLNSVIFTSVKDDTDYQGRGYGDTNLDDSATSASSKDWHGVKVYGFADIDYAKFRYAGNSFIAGTSGWWYTPTVWLHNSSSTIDDSFFEDSIIGVYSSGTGNPSISDTTFNRNRYVGISFVPGAYPILSSIFYGTGADANGFDAIGIGRPNDLEKPGGLPGCIEMSATTGSIPREDEVIGLLKIPYVPLRCFDVPSGKTLTIDPGVLIKMNGDWGRWNINSGATFLVGGTDDNLNSVIFTSVYDDTFYQGRSYGDTNLDGDCWTGAGVKPSPKNWSSIRVYGSATIEYAQFRYGGNFNQFSGASEGALLANGSSTTISHCIFEDNCIGVHSRGTGATQITDSTFNRNMPVGISFVPGANPILSDNIYGEGTGPGIDGNTHDLHNGLDALGLGAFSYGVTTTVSSASAISQENGITNLPNIHYFTLARLTFNANLTVNSGVVIKTGGSVAKPRLMTGPGYTNYDLGYPDQTLWTFGNGASLLTQGANCAPVIFTSIYDDSEGDTNCDGTATSPSAANWPGIIFNDGSSVIVNRTEFSYGDSTIRLNSADPVSFSRARFGNNNTGIYIYSGKTPNFTGFTETDFSGNVDYAINNNGTSEIDAYDLYWGDPSGPTHVTNQGDRLIVSCSGTCDWWGGSTEDAPIAYQLAPGGDFTIETKLEDYSVNSGTHAGIMLYSGRDDAYLWGRYYYYAKYSPSNYNGFALEKISGDIGSRSGGDESDPTLPAWLRIRVEAGVGYFEYKTTEGASWITVYSELLDFTPTNVGLFAKSSGGNSIDALFDYFNNDGTVDEFDNKLIDSPPWTIFPASGSIIESQTDAVGIGDKVSDNVNFIDFHTNAWGLCAPTVGDLISVVYGPCISEPLADLQWTYDEQTSSPQSGYLIELDDNGTFVAPLWTSCDSDPYCALVGTIVPPETSEIFTIGVPAGTLSYGNITYYWRIKVFDQELEESDWSSTDSFTTDDHAGPQVDRDVDPESPFVSTPVQFTDISICHDSAALGGGSYDCNIRALSEGLGNVTYYWDFDYDNPGVSTSPEVNPEHTYIAEGSYTVFQQVTDEASVTCGETFPMSTSLPLPTWREILPNF
ncbi:right-handed parallel beta-helix repeat-containing protein [Patescibacteria group bacterium]